MIRKLSTPTCLFVFTEQGRYLRNDQNEGDSG